MPSVPRFGVRSVIRNQACLVNVFLLLTSAVAAHPPEDNGKSPPHAAHDHQHQLQPGMILPQIDGPKPWSDKPVLDDPNRFQIAIMTDRTGGHRPGVWMKAVERLNGLRPDFVVSVGDLIEGYSEDEKVVQAEWQEFLGFVDKMQMKFFFVAGNHDLSNPMMHRLWRDRFGPEWYSFDYKGVHFICLCTEDPNFRIGDKQLGWLRQDLDKAKNARWTLLFMHKPLWWFSERYDGFGIADKTNWKAMSKLLQDRQHTIFAGHVHHYAQFERNGMKYYQLATTGGASQLRGVDYGEFDHITWLTMENDGPRVTNLTLDGIVPAGAITEQSLKRFREFLAKAKIEISPILLDGQQGLSEGRIDLRLINEFNLPITVSGQIEGLPLRGLTVNPASLELSAEPGKSSQIAVNVRFEETIPFAELSRTVFRAKIKAVGMNPLSAEQTLPVVIDRRYNCPMRSEPVTLDGKLDEWKELPYSTPNPPNLIGPTDQWQGMDDASVKFNVQRDSDHIYIGAAVTDDRVLDDTDGLAFLIDLRPIADRLRNPELGSGTYVMTASAISDPKHAKIRSANADKSVMKAAVRGTTNGYNVEAAIPTRLITDQQGQDWHSFQFTLIAQDVDEPKEEPVGVPWRGTPELRQRNTNYANFVRDQ